MVSYINANISKHQATVFRKKLQNATRDSGAFLHAGADFNLEMVILQCLFGVDEQLRLRQI